MMFFFLLLFSFIVKAFSHLLPSVDRFTQKLAMTMDATEMDEFSNIIVNLLTENGSPSPTFILRITFLIILQRRLSWSDKTASRERVLSSYRIEQIFGITWIKCVVQSRRRLCS